MAEQGLGLVQVYTGDGKGKTTAAIGLAVRAAGHGFRSFVGQFMKGTSYGELALEQMSGGLVTFRQLGTDSLVHTISQEDHDLARSGLNICREAIHSGRYQLVILDEINIAVHMGLLPESDVLSLIRQRAAGVELILTGRGATPGILAVADLVTEMRELRHPYASGIPAREGIER